MSSKIASLEQIIPPHVQTQKAIVIQGLNNHIDRMTDLIKDIEKAQTLEELLSSMHTAAQNVI